jgi:hypothetical protein
MTTPDGIDSRRALASGAVISLLVVIPLVAAPQLGRCAGPAVTVYSNDLGFVRELRALELGHDRDTVRLDVPERLDFSSVRLAPRTGRVARLAYRYDVANGDAALDRARGTRVRAMLRDDRLVEGDLVAADGSWLVVREDDGTLHTVARAAVEDVRLGEAQQGFVLRPTLEAVIEGRRGPLEAELSYLTGGLSWSAEHVLVRRGESGATWSSFVTVQNATGRDFVDAVLKLVAGEPSRSKGPPAPMAGGRMMAMSMAAEAAPDLSEQAFSEYHLYALDRPATLRDRESQSLSMIEPREIKVKPRYLYRGGDPRGVRAQLEVQNAAASGLGVPLPAGRVRIYEADRSGAVQFAGESAIGHTAVDEKMTLEVGAAFDLVAERRELYNKRIADREREYAVEIKLRNRKSNDVTILVEEGISGEVEITQQTHPFTRKDANTIQFELPVAAGKETVLRYTARARY